MVRASDSRSIGDGMPVTGKARLVLGVGTVVVAIGSIIGIVGNEILVRRLIGALPSNITPHDTAANLIHNAGIAGLLCCLALVVGWRWFTRRCARLSWLVLAGSVGVYLASACAIWWYVDDDAGITFVYARNLVQGHGLIYNLGDPPVEGYSNPLWLFVLAGARMFGADIVLAAKVLGAGCGVLCLTLLWHLGRRGCPWAWLALPLTATNASFVVWTNSGLENGLHAVLLTGLMCLLASKLTERVRTTLTVLVLSLLVLSRPEGAIFAIATAGYLGYQAYRGNATLRQAGVVLLVPMLVACALTIFRIAYFDDVLPNTYYAKADHASLLRLLNPFSGGWRYVSKAIAGGAWTIPLVPVILLLAHVKAWSKLATVAITIVTTQLIFVVSVNGDWMGEFRFMAALVPVMAVLVALAFSHLDGLLMTVSQTRGIRSVVWLVPSALLVVSQIPRVIVFAHEPTTPFNVVADVGYHLQEIARAHNVEAPTVLYHDAGGTAYLARIHLIDLGGLCDRTIAKNWRDRERIRSYIFDERRPTFICSGSTFSEKIGLTEFEQLYTDYVPLPDANEEWAAGLSVARMRADLAK